MPCEVRTFLDPEKFLSRDRPTSLRHKNDTLLHSKRQLAILTNYNPLLDTVYQRVVNQNQA